MIRLSVTSIAVLCTCLPLSLWAADPGVLIEGSGVQVTQTDVQAEMQRLPAATREAMMGRVDSLLNVAANLYQRRALAAEAEKVGLGKTPEVQTQLQIAQDRVLSDAQLAELDRRARPTAAALDALAHSAYKAQPQRFKHPEEIHARHILVAGNTPEARAKAEQLLDELRKGAKFDELARTQSDDKGSGARGGDLGWFAKGRMVPPFEAAAFALTAAGQRTELVESQFGFHIIELLGKRAEGLKPFDEVREELRTEAASSAIRSARELEVKRLMEAATIHQDAIRALASGKP